MLWYSCSAPRIDHEDLHRELSQLSTEEKEKVRNDIEGRKIGDDGNREKRRANEKLKELDRLLQSPRPAPDVHQRRPLRNENGGASFTLAQDKCPLYVNSDAFRLMILRSTDFNVEVRRSFCIQDRIVTIYKCCCFQHSYSLLLMSTILAFSNQLGGCCNTGRTSCIFSVPERHSVSCDSVI